MNTVRIAVVGLGMAAKPHLEALSQLQEVVKVAGVFNRSREKAEQVHELYGWPIYENAQDIAADPNVDGVILITPADQRKQFVKLFSTAGKHILSEKPIERNTEAATELVEICEAAKVKFGVVFQHRFRAGARRLRELVEASELGDLSLVRAEVPWWREQSYYDAPGRGTYARDGGGVLISQAIHVLDLMLSLTEPVETVQAFCAATKAHELEAEDFAAAGLRFASGTVGSVVATTATFPGTAESLVIDGTLGTASLIAGQLNVFWRDGRTEEVGELSATGGGADPMAFPCDWHRDLIADFAASISEDRQPRVSGREGLKVHRLIDALVRSSREGATVSLEQEGAEL
ncbi:Gfo/Idh/MocA family oxidoreductase [Pseudovibrio sp. Tun.PSC04-5.I4]|uniref:Gfo/Idh/MocA family protein n=1 Tax=Pseudovibrio sp. Tun.PSC04-5.I4 TaxID=1798213 RepID=UPI00087E585B|nr:Gfo/Idh/MocA family oxidoreductase [Pseudovibrio sp. Tun.PSC04-5.I4]SDQ16905.1 Predicted dehydrogenase [Pseudovibrio sp. Tun.PSC04-5.I4]